MKGEGVFTPLAAAVLAGLIAVAIVIAVIVAAYSPARLGIVVGDSGIRSHSAIGHGALIALIERLGIPVRTGVAGQETQAAIDDLLVIPAPDPERSSADAIARRINQHVGPVLVVLPEWRRPGGAGFTAHIDIAERVEAVEVDALLGNLGVGAGIRRTVATGPLQPGSWPVPTVPTIQVVQPGYLAPEITDADGGVIFGQILDKSGREIWILSDPDMSSNHGLGLGRNAVLMARAIERLLPQGAAVVFDWPVVRTVSSGRMWRELLRPPLLPVTLLSLLAAGIALWAGQGRIGTPRGEPPALRRGKDRLIDNTVDLLVYGGQGDALFDAYLTGHVHDAGRALGAPAHLHGAALMDWLDDRAQRLGRSERIGEIAEARTADRKSPGIIATVRRIHAWHRAATS